jgi:hypothetical protein
MILKKILQIILSFNNIFIINIIFFFQKLRNRKIIVFYHPRKDLKKISDYYINSLFDYKFKNYYVLLLDCSSNNLISIKYVAENFLNLIYGVDVFFNNYLCENFPNKSKRIYLHHDIYDTPLANKRIEKEIKKKVINYDYILLASKKSKKVFDNLKLDYKKNNLNIEIIGYYKLDFLNKIKKKTNDTKTLVIAPTNFISFPELSLYKHINQIIDSILNFTNYKIVLRPHPSNFFSNKIKKLNGKYNLNDRFKLDISDNYFKTYTNSNLMISDLSGTAYTYSFLTGNPVIFFSNYENKLKILNYDNLNFFKDRKKIGFIVNNQKSLIKTISNKKLKSKIKTQSKKLKNFFLVGSTKERFDNFVKKIL